MEHFRGNLPCTPRCVQFNLSPKVLVTDKVLPNSIPITKTFRTDWVNPNQPPTDYVLYLLDYSFNELTPIVGLSVGSGIYNSIDAGLIKVYLTPVAGIFANVFIREPGVMTFPIINAETPPDEGTPLVNDIFSDRILHNFSTNSFMYVPCNILRLVIQIQIFDPLFSTPAGASIELQTSFTIHVLQ